MKALKFRRAESSDAALLTGIAFAGKQSWGYPAQWMELWRHDLVVNPQYIRNESVLVAECEGEVIGFTGLSLGEKGRHLEHLWLQPKYIGHGFGRALFEKAIWAAREEGVVQLFIDSDPNAESFYLKMGAIRIGQEVYPLPGGIVREVPLLVYQVS